MNADELRELTKRIETVRVEALFGGDDDERMTPEAEALFMMALAQLELAKQSMNLATYALMQKR